MIPYSKTNLPKRVFAFRENRTIMWLVNLLGVDGPFYVEVKSYSFEDHTRFESQQNELNIDRLIFEGLDWNLLEPLLTSYQTIAFASIAKNTAPKSKGKVEPGFGTAFGKQINPHQHLFPVSHESKNVFGTVDINHPAIISESPFQQNINVNFSVPFSHVIFHDGYVSFQHRIKEVYSVVEFRIDNEYIRKEYDTVKNWFSRKLGVKRIEVQAIIKVESGDVISVEATSPEIQAINPALIEKIKEYRTLELVKAAPQLVDKSLYTADDVFSALSFEEKGNVFAQTDAQLLNILMQKTAVRSREQLQLLSNYHSEEIKLRFTLKPSFGFVFLISCGGYNHFIWELLETHATYVWSIPEYLGEADEHYNQIEEIITGINKGGRQSYRRKYKNGETDKNAIFRFIEHNEGGGFMYWKIQLEKLFGIELFK